MTRFSRRRVLGLGPAVAAAGCGVGPSTGSAPSPATAPTAGDSAPSTSPTPSHPPTPTPRPVAALPRGGTEIFPTHRLVGYCGYPGSPALGRLGTGDLDARAAEIERGVGTTPTAARCCRCSS